MTPCENPLDCGIIDIPFNKPNRPVVINFERTGITNGVACLQCSVTNTENLIDEDRSNFATINTLAGLGVENSVSIKDLANKYPIGTTVA